MRLEKGFRLLGKSARSIKCDGMDGLIDEADSLMANLDDPETVNAALIFLAQAVTADEIARYGTLVAQARQLGQHKMAARLQATFDEEYGAEKALSKLAEDRLNAAAA